MSPLGFTIAAFIVALAVINAIVAAVFSANDSARNHAIQRALGTTPVQTVTAFLVAHLAAGLVACALGIPLGIAFYSTSIRGGILDPIGLSPLTYVATILTAVLLYAVIAFIRRGSSPADASLRNSPTNSPHHQGAVLDQGNGGSGTAASTARAGPVSPPGPRAGSCGAPDAQSAGPGASARD